MYVYCSLCYILTVYECGLWSQQPEIGVRLPFISSGLRAIYLTFLSFDFTISEMEVMAEFTHDIKCSSFFILTGIFNVIVLHCKTILYIWFYIFTTICSILWIEVVNCVYMLVLQKVVSEWHLLDEQLKK